MQSKQIKTEGRPSYNPKVLLKLYFYGYLNGLRSSRRLEKECKRNIELQWLMQKLIPNYHTISDFRKENPQALKNTFKLFVLFLKDMGLVSGHTVAIDGTKVRAHNSKKNNYNPVVKGKNKKAAIIAVCNKLLKQVFGCVKNGVKFQDNYQVNYCLFLLAFLHSSSYV